MFFFFKRVVELLYTHDVHPLQPLSGPCSIEIMYSREWRVAIPASLMWVDNALHVDLMPSKDVADLLYSLELYSKSVFSDALSTFDGKVLQKRGRPW